MGGPVQIPHPSDEEIIHASFRHSSMPMNIVRMLKADEDPPVEGYNPFDEIKGTPYEEYAAHFTYSQSPSETAKIKQQITRRTRTTRLSLRVEYLALWHRLRQV